MTFWDFMHKNGDGLGLLAFVLIGAIFFFALFYMDTPSEKIRLEEQKTEQIRLMNKCSDHEEKEKE